jgi:hypothetical protein
MLSVIEYKQQKRDFKIKKNGEKSKQWFSVNLNYDLWSTTVVQMHLFIEYMKLLEKITVSDYL